LKLANNLLPIEHFLTAAKRWPERIAVKDGPCQVTYGELAWQVNALAAAMQSIDPARQSRVGICAYNTFEHLISWLATFAAGKIWIPLNPRNGAEELNRVIAATQPSIVVIDADHLKKIASQGATRIVGKPGLYAGGDKTLADLCRTFEGAQPVRHELGLDDVQAIKFTGGSSGQPKGCVQTYRVWNTCITSILAAFEFEDADNRHLLAAPMTHGANTLIIPTFAIGGTQVFMDKTGPAAILQAIERDRITTVFLPPTVIYMMLAEQGVESRNFSALRHLIVGGAAIRRDVVPQAMKIFNNALETCFGQTEAPQIAACMRATDWQEETNYASTGRATALTEIKVMDPDGRILSAGESGEIVLRGDLVMQGYLNMPEKTAETIIDGWLHTGDIGIVDKRGFVFIKDRIRDVIITGGFNVYPSDVEAVLGRHPDVKECVVFGISDMKWGEAVVAAVELHHDATVTGQAITAFIKQQMDSVKTPKAVHIVDELPRSPVGKVLRREAKAQFITQHREPTR